MANRSKKNYLASGLAVLAITALAVTFLASSGAAQNTGSTLTGNTPGFVKKAADRFGGSNNAHRGDRLAETAQRGAT